MSDDQPGVISRRRSRGPEVTARAGALERLKALRSGGRRSDAGGGYTVKVEDPIYDTVPEEEYDKLVARRREEAQGFIVDDDGLGYGDEGEEEDWSRGGLDYSSEEDEPGEKRQKRKKTEQKEKNGERKRVNPALSAAAAMMGKQRISAMFTSSVFKNRDLSKGKGADCESIVDDVIAEFAPDEVDKERRRRGIAHLGARKGSGFVQVKVENEGNLVAKKENLGLGNGGCGVENGSEVVVEVKREEMERDGEEVGLGGLESKESEVKEEVERKGLELREDVGVVVKEEGRKSLNAKVTREGGDLALSAMAEWQAFRSGGSLVNGGVKEDVISGLSSDEISEFEPDADGLLPFYILDAHEEFFNANMGTVYLFGKVKAGSTYHSCCVVVKNMQRCIYAIPKSSVFCTDEILRLEKDVEEARVSPTAFRKKLQDMAYEVKEEIGNQLVALNVSTFSMTPVKRRYAFERSDIPKGENYVLKISYPFKDPPLAADLKGENFCAVLGTHCSALELFLVKRKVKGPSWLSVSKFSTCPPSQRVSWCKFEITIDSPKDIWVSPSSKSSIEIPHAVVSAINLKTILNKKQNTNEIVSASLVCCHKAKIDTPMLTSEWKTPGMLSHFTVVRKLDGGIFPMGFTKEAEDRNMKAGTCVLVVENSERALLNRLMIEIHKLDSDVLVGHNISMFDLDVLLHRAQACKIPCYSWSKIGRLKRSTMPRLNWGKSSGASPGITSCIAGRLLCDTDVCSHELLKEVSFSLTQLAKNRLNKDRKEIAPHDIPTMFQTSSSLVELIECGETDAWLSIELMFHLSVLPLTRQLTNISGNLWGKTLQGGRAQRVEYLLLHAFHAKKYIVPDKISYYAKEAKSRKRRINHGDEDVNDHELDVNADNYKDDVPDNDHGKVRKGPAYAGGLVLEPKKGLYDKYVLLLDFNSLYPSIIQEYNICFTTVERSQDGIIPQLPSSKITGVLPELLKNLVERRRMVKKWMKTASGLKVQQLDIQQQALKLIANSMYGCLGYDRSRFYAKPLAELITLQGREILQSAVDLVQNNMNLEVIYGDTDSIMIYSGLDDIAKAKEIAGKVAQEVNKKYRCLEIELDGLYKRMLLQKKKKYAAVKLQFKDGTPDEVIEMKGLDMVRRDWSLLSKEIGNYCLSQILSGGSCEDVVESIHKSLMKVQEDMRNGLVELEKYVITKTLTKPPEAYTDAKNQPHVLVALRLKQSGYTTGCSSGDTVPYIICCEQGVGSGGLTGIAQRARHPDELVRDDGKWIVDIDYYLSQQILPVVSRLCASIQGTSLERLADCLGLDSSKFQSKVSEADTNDASSSLLFSVNDEERYQNCEPLIISCPSCSSSFKCPSVFSSLCTSSDEKQTEQPVEESTSNFWRRMRCPKCPEEGDIGRIFPAMIANQVKMQAERFLSMYYKGVMTCDDETCKHTTCRLNLRLMGDSEMGTICPYYPRCNGRLIRKYTEADLYKQLTYFCYLLDTVRCVEKMDAKTRIPLEREFAKVRPATDLALYTIQSIRDRCAYGWVRLDEIAVIV